MIRYLVIATILSLAVACGEATPTRWPTTTPVLPSGALAATEGEVKGVPDAGSGDAATAASADTSGDSASGDSPSGDAATPVPIETSVDASSGESASGDDGATGSVEASNDEGGSMVESDVDVVITESGLRIKDLVVGTGEQARVGAIVAVHYTGWLLDGTKFDSSVDRGTPFEFNLGQGNVIQGWDEGVATMRVGGKRELTIPPELAYGDRDRGPVIKAGSTLVFEIELLEVKDP